MCSSSPAPAPTSTSVTQTSIPEYAKPYVETMLGKTEALAGTPYQPYGQERQAGFTPMQQQAFQGAQNMQPSNVTGFGTQLAGAAGLGALGANYDPTQFQAGQFDQAAASQYMSPYMQSVVGVQQQEAQRQADIAGTQRSAQATGAGAFGGSRQAIMDAEAARNLATQKGAIQATGLQNAYAQAQQQYNADQARQMQAQQAAEQSRQYGAGYGMQGLQTALQGAGQLGTLGGQQFQQGMDVNKLQQATGATQQAQQQQALTQQYQDFLTQKQAPYQQLSYMSDMLRGLPMSQSTQQLFQAPPTALSQAGTLGLGAYGVSQLMKADGGSVSSYAEGGITGDANVSNILKGLSDPQLEQAKQSAMERKDINQVNMIVAEQQQRAQTRSGISAAPQQEQGGIASAASDSMMDRMLPTEEGMARGGIVAFADGGAPSYETSLTELSDSGYTPMTPEQQREETLKQQQFLKTQYGASVMDPYLAEIKAERASAGEEGGRMARGLGALAAAAALGKRGQTTGEGVSQALGAFGGTYGQIAKENKAADRALRSSEMTLAQAGQARDEGMFKEARGLTATAEAQRAAGLAAKRDIAGKKATIQSGMEKSRLEQAAQSERNAATVGAAIRGQDVVAKTASETAENIRRGQDITAETARRPDASERQLKRMEEIFSGDVPFRGKSGQEGVDAYLEQTSSAREASLGAKYTGPAAKALVYSPDDKATAELLGTQRAMLLGKTDKKSVTKLKGIEDQLTAIKEKYAAPAAAAPRPRPAPGAAPRAAGPEAAAVARASAAAPAVNPQAVEMLRQDPTPANMRYFDTTFGPGAAARVLGN